MSIDLDDLISAGEQALSEKKKEKKKSPGENRRGQIKKQVEKIISTPVDPRERLYASNRWRESYLSIYVRIERCACCATTYESPGDRVFLVREHPRFGTQREAFRRFNRMSYAHLPRHVEHEEIEIPFCPYCFTAPENDDHFEQLELTFEWPVALQDPENGLYEGEPPCESSKSFERNASPTMLLEYMG